MSVPARKRRTAANPRGLQYAVCEGTGKRGYRSKKDARVARQRHPKDGLHVYRCDGCGHFHLGHLPLLVRSGVVSRGGYYEAVRERAAG